MRKIAIVTAAWKRPELLEFFCKFWSAIQKQLADRIELKIYCAISDHEANRIIARYGFAQVFVPNNPLHAKWNAVTKRAQMDQPDYCIFLGSDDIMNITALLAYAKLMDDGHDYIATTDWFFYDTRTKQMIYWGGYKEQYRAGEPCGAGRALSKRMLDQLKWEPWGPGYDTMLDTIFTIKTKAIPHTKYFFQLGTTGAAGMDIKTGTNMTPFAHWNNTKVIPSAHGTALALFDEWTYEQISKLKP